MELKNNLSKTMLLFVLMLIAFTSQAQTFGEFFNQKKTQKRYLLEQIAALQIYIGYAKKGYDIANSGLQTIKDISGGEFSLHNAFISSLKSVSPFVQNNVKVAEIISCQIRIGKAFSQISYGSLLSPGDQLYVLEVKENIMEECGKDLEELLLVITSGRVEMDDEQRITRLDKVYESMQDKYAFTTDFVSEVSLLIRQKENEIKSIHQLLKSHGIIE